MPTFMKKENYSLISGRTVVMLLILSFITANSISQAEEAGIHHILSTGQSLSVGYNSAPANFAYWRVRAESTLFWRITSSGDIINLCIKYAATIELGTTIRLAVPREAPKNATASQVMLK